MHTNHGSYAYCVGIIASNIITQLISIRPAYTSPLLHDSL